LSKLKVQPRARPPGFAKEKKVGKTRFYGSASAEDQTGGFEQADDRWIDVERISHLNSKCPRQ
jgi:hypothetical protein